MKCAAIAVAVMACVAPRAFGQTRHPLPPTRADELLDEGRWSEAEALFYQQSEGSPRDPIARAALGRFIAMKGAVRPGIVLIEEARQFGLDAGTARELLAPLRAILEWRNAANEFKRDSTVTVRVPRQGSAIFQIPLPRTDSDGRPLQQPGNVSETVWYSVVDRAVGIDSLSERSQPIGIEVFEALVPSLNTRTNQLTLHANQRTALSATGKRYQVLRTPREVRVLVGEGRVLPLVEALRELAPSWWQLDLVHGLLVTR